MPKVEQFIVSPSIMRALFTVQASSQGTPNFFQIELNFKNDEHSIVVASSTLSSDRNSKQDSQCLMELFLIKIIYTKYNKPQLKKYTPIMIRQLLNKCHFTKELSVRTSKKLVLNKKQHRQLVKLKAQLAKKQPQPEPSLYKDYHYRQVYKHISIDMESFFFKRELTLQNFNFLLQVMAEHEPSDYLHRMEEVLNKMNILHIEPDYKTYTYLIKLSSNMKDLQKAEQLFEEACSKFLPNKFLYTTLLQAYTKNNNPHMGMKIVQEMEDKGIEVDLPAYTTLINCYRMGRKLTKCWELHRKVVKLKLEQDETYTGVMMTVYAATHDAEKAIKMYRENIQQKFVKPMVETTNAYFKALSSRKEYSGEVVDKFFRLAEEGEMMDEHTVAWALRACSKTANIKSAIQIIKILKLKNLPLTKNIFNNMLKVYSSVCAIPILEEEYREVVQADAWKLLEEMQERKMVDTYILNSMLSIYATSLNIEEIDGLILPLYDKFGLSYNVYTFQILMDMYYRVDDLNQAVKIWTHLNEHIDKNSEKFMEGYEHRNMMKVVEKDREELRPTFKALNVYLKIGIKMQDMRIVLNALEMFHSWGKMPPNQILKFLGTLDNLPEQIRVALMKFPIQFGQAKISKKKQPNIDDPQNK